MGNVEEIVKLEGQGQRTQRASSADRWRAAKLIWTELQIKSYRELSEEIINAGGKGSLPHLNRAQKCWQSMVDQGTDGAAPEDLPDFSHIYQSEVARPEKAKNKVHHLPDPEPDDKPEPHRPRPRRGDRDHDDDEPVGPRPNSAAGLIAIADQAIGKLVEHRAFWQTMTDEDLLAIDEVIVKLNIVIAGVADSR